MERSRRRQHTPAGTTSPPMCILLWFSVAFLAAGASGRKTKVDTEVNFLLVEFQVLHPRIANASEFAARVRFTNKSSRELRLNTLLLNIPKVLLKVRKHDGTPVYPGPPGYPPIDDGEIGRINLKPGESVAYEYSGSQYFGTSLAPGKYEVRFWYENTLPQRGDWTGVIETEWVGFEVKPSRV
jgi:hypothetical protein